MGWGASDDAGTARPKRELGDNKNKNKIKYSLPGFGLI